MKGARGRAFRGAGGGNQGLPLLIREPAGSVAPKVRRPILAPGLKDCP